MADGTEVIKNRIIAAFSDVAYPGDDALGASPRGYDFESDDVAKYFKGKNWQDYVDNPLELLTSEITSALFFMSAEGFQYFLPLYLVASLNSFDGAEPHSVQLVSSLSPAFMAGAQENVSRRLRPLSVQQRKIVLAAFQYLEARPSELVDMNLLKSAITALESSLKSKDS